MKNVVELDFYVRDELKALAKYGDRNLKLLQEFDYAIENDFVDKFYLGCKGC